VGARTEYKEEGRFSGAIRSIREHGSGGKREHSVTQRSAFSDQPSAISLQQSARQRLLRLACCQNHTWPSADS